MALQREGHEGAALAALSQLRRHHPDILERRHRIDDAIGNENHLEASTLWIGFDDLFCFCLDRLLSFFSSSEAAESSFL